MAKKKQPSLKRKVDPNEVLARYRALVPHETYACILAELDRALPQGLRTNQLQGITPEVVNRTGSEIWLGAATRSRFAGTAGRCYPPPRLPARRLST